MDMALMMNEVLTNGRFVALLVLAGLMTLELMLQVTGFARGEENGFEFQEARVRPDPPRRGAPRR